MFNIIHPGKYWSQTKPPLGAQINFGHPLARGLVGCWLMNEGGGSLAYGIPLSGKLVGGGLAPQGIISSATIPIYAEIPNVGPLLDGKFLTVVAGISVNSLATTYPRIIDRVYNGQFCFYVTSGAGGTANLSGAIAGTVASADFSSAEHILFQYDRFAVVAMTWDGTYTGWFLDGRISKVTGATGVLKASSSIMRIGERAEGTNRNFRGLISFVYVFEVCHSDANVLNLCNNPYQLLYVPTPRTWFLGGAAALPERFGAADITLGALTAISAGAVAVAGAATVTLGAATCAATGVVAINGSATPTLGAVTLSSTGTIAVSGSAAVTLGTATLLSTGLATVTGVMSLTLGAATCASAGSVSITATCAATLGVLTLESAGSVGTTVSTGTLTATLGAATANSTGTVTVTGSATITLGALTLVSDQGRVGNLSVILGEVTVFKVTLIMALQSPPTPAKSAFSVPESLSDFSPGALGSSFSIARL